MKALASQQEFATRERRTSFSVRVEQSPPAIVILVPGRTVKRIVEEELIDFWRQLRTHGYIQGHIAPDHRHLSYLMPIFEQLDYVRSIAESDSVNRLRTNPRATLQVIPPPLMSEQSASDRVGSTAVAAQA